MSKNVRELSTCALSTILLRSHHADDYVMEAMQRLNDVERELNHSNSQIHVLQNDIQRLKQENMFLIQVIDDMTEDVALNPADQMIGVD